MVWDGACAFCAYWVEHWQQGTGNAIDYAPYQEVAERFPDINRRHFMMASRLIETDGQIFSGPRSAYRTFTYGASSWAFMDRWYSEKAWFRKLSDRLYHWVTKHRGKLYRLTTFLFGSDPQSLKPFWFIYLVILAYLLFVAAGGQTVL